ncbi:hypothetical protein KGM_209906 [Danaus plexippus plexippus]|uniref:Uncharacterized protein n=1 Tax=Danaus plexippus plexippus TaxID=278856 RepID=A0A212EJY9_DANPL|nr:hypothetical protein KGM_209906 [Danaus plexippus plexippus]
MSMWGTDPGTLFPGHESIRCSALFVQEEIHELASVVIVGSRDLSRVALPEAERHDVDMPAANGTHDGMTRAKYTDVPHRSHRHTLLYSSVDSLAHVTCL